MEKTKERRDRKSKVAKRILDILHGGGKSRLDRLLDEVVLMHDSGHFKKEFKLFYLHVQALHAEKRL